MTDTGHKQYCVRLPPALESKLAKEAARRKLTVSALLVESAILRYGVDAPLPKRGIKTGGK